MHQLRDLSVRQQSVGLHCLGYSRHIVEQYFGLSGGHASLDEVLEVSVGNNLRGASDRYTVDGSKQQGVLGGGDANGCYAQVGDSEGIDSGRS